MRAGVGEIEIDFAADEIVHDNVLPWRTEPQRTLIFKNMAAVLKFFQVALVSFSALALKVRTQISADMRTFVPIQSEPFQTFLNCDRAFLGIPLPVSVFDWQH